MPEYVTYLDTSDFEVTVDYSVHGSYRRATHEDPPEEPEVEIECFRIDKKLALMLGIDEVLDSTRVEQHINIDELSGKILEDHNAQEPECDYDDDRY